MSYAHYWMWENPMTDSERFSMWSRDVGMLLEEYPDYPNHWYYEGHIPVPLPKNWAMKKICGPFGTGEPIITKTEVAFNGDGEAHNMHDGFRIRFEELQQPHGFRGCRTNCKPYDLLVTAALVRLRSYFPEVYLSSDGKERGFQQGAQFCRDVFGIGEIPEDIVDEDLLER